MLRGKDVWGTTRNFLMHCTNCGRFVNWNIETLPTELRVTCLGCKLIEVIPLVQEKPKGWRNG